MQAASRVGRRFPLLYAGRLLAIAFAGSGIAIGVSAWLGQSKQAAELPSVAILPCDYEGLEEHAFLGPAAAEEVHAKLAKVAGIQIPAWRSVLKSVQVGEDKRQIVFGMDNALHVDERYLSLAGRKAEAMNALTRAVREQQTLSGYLSPGRQALLTDRALDPLREEPEYAPQIERLLEEQEAWLAPAREREAKALETGDWASLRTLLGEDFQIQSVSQAVQAAE